MFSGNIYKLRKEFLSDWTKDASSGSEEDNKILNSIVPQDVFFKIIDFIDDEHCIIELQFLGEKDWEKLEEPMEISELLSFVEEHQCTPEEAKRLSNIIED